MGQFTSKVVSNPESLQLGTEGLVQQQVSESQRVGLELSLKQ